MFLYILFAILCLIVLVFLESFSLSLFGLSIIFVLFLFLYRRIDWRLLFAGGLTIMLFMDVVLNMPLGVTFLVSITSLLCYFLFTIFLSTEVGVFAYIFKILTLVIFNILYIYTQRFLTFGDLGYFDINIFISSFVRAVVGLGLLIIIERLIVIFRGKQKGSGLRFK
ncbi:MAG: hypothetical protein AB9915_02290 [Candidatus Dojkabacteria bacterium]